jgi:hypothetical protein
MSTLLAAILFVDGTVTAVWGHGFIRWQQRIVPDWYAMALDALLDWPEQVLRVAAAGEAFLGGLWLARLLRRKPGDDQPN